VPKEAFRKPQKSCEGGLDAQLKAATFSNPVPIVGDRTEMYITQQPRPRCRRCRVPVKADAGRCHSCGALYPTSELLAVVLSRSAVVVYLIAVLAFITLWFLR
jgi:hypothetical protein